RPPPGQPRHGRHAPRQRLARRGGRGHLAGAVAHALGGPRAARHRPPRLLHRVGRRRRPRDPLRRRLRPRRPPRRRPRPRRLTRARGKRRGWPLFHAADPLAVRPSGRPSCPSRHVPRPPTPPQQGRRRPLHRPRGDRRAAPPARRAAQPAPPGLPLHRRAAPGRRREGAGRRPDAPPAHAPRQARRDDLQRRRHAPPRHPPPPRRDRPRAHRRRDALPRPRPRAGLPRRPHRRGRRRAPPGAHARHPRPPRPRQRRAARGPPHPHQPAPPPGRVLTLTADRRPPTAAYCGRRSAVSRPPSTAMQTDPHTTSLPSSITRSDAVVVSGIQPSGALHLGNYFGAIRQHVALAADPARGREAYFFIVNYHALTSLRDPEALARYTLDVALDYLALGFDPERAHLFLQSDVPQVTELTWVFLCLTPVAHLEKGVAYKDKIAQ